MRRWCWKRLEEEWKNWQKLVMTEIAKKDNFLAVRQSFSMKTYNMEIHKHDRDKLLFRSYEIELKSSFRGSSISWTWIKTSMTCIKVCLLFIGIKNKKQFWNKLYFFLQKNLRYNMTADKSYFTENTEHCGPASWMHDCTQSIIIWGAEGGG